jgi:hypothetical protein
MHQAWLKGQAEPAHPNQLDSFAETSDSAPESLVIVHHKTLVG